MKIFIAFCFDGREPWQVRQSFVKDSHRFTELLESKGFTVINFASGVLPHGFDTESIESCIALADAVVAFKGRTMLGASETVREFAKKYHKPIFEFVFQDSGYVLRDFTFGRRFTWPEIQQVSITDYEDVFSRLTPIEIKFAQVSL